MKIFRYATVSGEFAGDSTAAESPLESGVFLVPAFHTAVEPPEVSSGYAAFWNGSAWALVEDHRGETGYINGTAFVVTDLGAYPEGWSTTPPAPDPNKAIDAQIAALEATVTQRRLREAALTETGKAWLADLDAQIAALRAQRV